MGEGCADIIALMLFQESPFVAGPMPAKGKMCCKPSLQKIKLPTIL